MYLLIGVNFFFLSLIRPFQHFRERKVPAEGFNALTRDKIFLGGTLSSPLGGNFIWLLGRLMRHHEKRLKVAKVLRSTPFEVVWLLGRRALLPLDLRQ